VPVIDVKAHPIAPDMGEYPPSDRKSWEGRPASSWEQLMAFQDEAGIEKTVLVQSTGTYGFDNRYAAAGPKTYPDRFAWVGSVDVLAPDGAERMEYWTREWGMSGLRIPTTGRTQETGWLADRATFPVWAKAVELGIPVGVLNIGEAGLLRIEEIVQRFPGLTLIMDHLLSPPLSRAPREDLVEAFFRLANYPGVHVQLTGPEFEPEVAEALDRYLPRAIDAFGTERLLWGSNFPTSPGSPGLLLKAAQSRLSFLPEADLNRIFYTNALNVYPALR